MKWQHFYPHETFVKLLQTTYKVLSGQSHRSIWVEGAYGTGKSHAVLTVKSLLDVSTKELKAYFDDFKLSSDLRDQYISLKENNKILTVHRIGSSDIDKDEDLVMAIQLSIVDALKKQGYTNFAEGSVKDSLLTWLEKTPNRNFFADLMKQPENMLKLPGQTVEQIENRLKTGDLSDIKAVMNKVLNILKGARVNLLQDVPEMRKWIIQVIRENHLDAILFVWDEFSEYFINHPLTLTGFQTLAEISQSDPFYFMIVTHESKSLFQDQNTAKKILDRFENTIKIELPDNMAFQLMAQAMKTTDNQELKKKWEEVYRPAIIQNLGNVLNRIEDLENKQNKFGSKTKLKLLDFQNIIPLHPYAALMLKNIAVIFNSNQRSMFDFIISDDTEDKSFKWYIHNFGPNEDDEDKAINLLTVDLLWDFFYKKGQNGLNDDVRGILENYSTLQAEKLLSEQQRVIKTILLLQAISLRVAGNELLLPTRENLDLAFGGMGWPSGRAIAIAKGLIDKGLIFEMPIAGGGQEYCAARSGSVDNIQPLRDDTEKEIKENKLIEDGELKEVIPIPASIERHFVIKAARVTTFNKVVTEFKGTQNTNCFKLLITFAYSENEIKKIRQMILQQVDMPSNDIIFIETLTPFGDDLYKQYVDNMAYGKYYLKIDKNKNQSRSFTNQGERALSKWKQHIEEGAYCVYTPEIKTPERQANSQALEEKLKTISHQKYPYSADNYKVTDTLYNVYQMRFGAKAGIIEDATKAYTSCSKVLKDAWKVKDYWKDPVKQSLPIVQTKKRIDEIVEEGFKGPQKRVSFLEIVEKMQQPPFGLIPSGITALILGFALKEYATSDYYWSLGPSSDPMTPDIMAKAIENALKQQDNPSNRYNEEYIVLMSPEIRSFLHRSAEIFKLPQELGSVENARNQIRIKMKSFEFPIWCLKSLLPMGDVLSDVSTINKVIDDYCGLVNTRNSDKSSESGIADEIGALYLHYGQPLVDDLKSLFTSDNCRKGMAEYLRTYDNGLLIQLAKEIQDNGNYLEKVKNEFSSSEAKWLWSIETANSLISGVILDYKIIKESSKTLGNFTTLEEIIDAWNVKTNWIKVPYQCIAKETGDLSLFLKELFNIKSKSEIENKEYFYSLLCTQREAFEDFYNHQITYFKRVAKPFLGDLDDSQIKTLYDSFDKGQFIRDSTTYYNYVDSEVKSFIQDQWKQKLLNLWKEKTNTNSPVEWSDKFTTPILCMFDDHERPEAEKMFTIIMQSNPMETEAKEAMAWLEKGSFYGRLNSPEERDKCFVENFLGDASILLDDLRDVRNELRNSVMYKVYDWMDNSTVKKSLANMVEAQYKLKGYERAMGIINAMDTDQLREYLKQRITNDPEFGLQILKGK